MFCKDMELFAAGDAHTAWIVGWGRNEHDTALIEKFDGADHGLCSFFVRIDIIDVSARGVLHIC